MDEDKVIQENMGLVYKQLHKFNLVYDDEAFSYAVEGLMSAARTYDKEKGFAMSTYASVCIYNAIGQYLRKKRNEPVTLSYEAEVCDGVEFIEILKDENTPETEYIKKERILHLRKSFKKVYNELPQDVHKRIIRYWYKSGFTAGQCTIAQATGVSQACVSRVLATFRHKLKKEMEEYEC